MKKTFIMILAASAVALTSIVAMRQSGTEHMPRPASENIGSSTPAPKASATAQANMSTTSPSDATGKEQEDRPSALHVYKASRHAGEIGIREGKNHDNPEDNLFEISIDGSFKADGRA